MYTVNKGMYMLELPSQSIELIESEIDNIRTKYDPKKISDLERVAKKEYGVKECVFSPLFMFGSEAIRTSNNDFYIFYYASHKPRITHAFGHEMGHLAIGHLNKRNIPIKPADKDFLELEANYFSAKLNNITLDEYDEFLIKDVDCAIRKSLEFNEQKRLIEIMHLRELGVYDIFMQSGGMYPRTSLSYLLGLDELEKILKNS